MQLMVCSVHFFVSLSVLLCVCLSAKYDGIDSSGEVSLEVSALHYPATGEFDARIRGQWSTFNKFIL